MRQEVTIHPEETEHGWRWPVLAYHLDGLEVVAARQPTYRPEELEAILRGDLVMDTSGECIATGTLKTGSADAPPLDDEAAYIQWCIDRKAIGEHPKLACVRIITPQGETQLWAEDAHKAAIFIRYVGIPLFGAPDDTLPLGERPDPTFLYEDDDWQRENDWRHHTKPGARPRPYLDVAQTAHNREDATTEEEIARRRMQLRIFYACVIAAYVIVSFLMLIAMALALGGQ